MARQFVCKSDGRSTIKNSGLRKFDPVRAFLKVSRELLSFFSLSLSHLSFSDPTTMILVPIPFFFLLFLFERDKICLFNFDREKTENIREEYRCAVMLTRLECR